MHAGRPLRIVLTSYRSKPHCGGQGVYVRHLSRELAALGHRVEVLSGQPYPELDRDDITLTRLPSLDLYADEDPFRNPRLAEFRDWIDVAEWAYMRTGGFPEPLTFSWRALRELRGRIGRIDVVHDNQTLGYGMLRLRRTGVAMVTSIHHPISQDRRIAIDAASGGLARFGARRWYGFVRMQGRVARRCGRILTVSETSKASIASDFHVDARHIAVVALGVDTSVFKPPAGEGDRVAGRVIAVASADTPLKGVDVLLRAIAKAATERDIHLHLVGQVRPDGPIFRLIGELGIADRVTVLSGLSDTELAGQLASAEIAVVPSRYEGFSLPALEFMACGTPLIATTAGALPEVTGEAATLVERGDAEQMAAALRRLHDSPGERERLRAAGLARVAQRYTWAAVARATEQQYRAELAVKAAGRC
ncbi:glycosyl transferase family 1 [Rhizocola hellebori]|uniref:Glycosyl transferase family 1 n=1 Tax=Rhizocola hellebori TaxID=1392758 RepID=A0A8J3Q2W7_9ACTN|nr:glycosyl transferase family 1 [Rhizocola hellebori]